MATEDIIFLLNGLGIKHGINSAKLTEASNFILHELDQDTNSRAGRALQTQAAIR